MKLLLYIYECKNCGSEFKAAQLAGIPYGEFLLRSDNDELSYLYAIEDDIFNECNQMLKMNPKLYNMKDTEIADILHRIYCYICDSSPTGNRYHIGKQPNCPNCYGEQMSSWRPTQPPESINLNVPSVTYEMWNKLSKEEKISCLDKLVVKIILRKL